MLCGVRKVGCIILLTISSCGSQRYESSTCSSSATHHFRGRNSIQNKHIECVNGQVLYFLNFISCFSSSSSFSMRHFFKRGEKRRKGENYSDLALLVSFTNFPSLVVPLK